MSVNLDDNGYVVLTGKVLRPQQHQLGRLDKSPDSSPVQHMVRQIFIGDLNRNITYTTPILIPTTTPNFSFFLICNPQTNLHGNSTSTISHTPLYTPQKTP